MSIISRILLIGLAIFLTACEEAMLANSSSPDSELKQLYAAAETNLLDLGKMRTDTNPKDAPFSYDDLVKNFTRVALYNEYRISRGKFVASQSETYLRRWEGPVRVSTVFGNSVTEQERKRDGNVVTSYSRKLASLTGLDISSSSTRNANLLILFLNEDEQIEFAKTIEERFPDVDPAVIDAFRDSPRNIFCAAFAFTKAGDKGVYDHAFILVKSEHSGFMRKSCIHEEMAQAMGLTNDSPTARPSIFNDDEEFAYLTKHDEILLRMLYDSRLSAGMELYEVRPLLPGIAYDVVRAGGY